MDFSGPLTKDKHAKQVEMILQSGVAPLCINIKGGMVLNKHGIASNSDLGTLHRARGEQVLRKSATRTGGITISKYLSWKDAGGMNTWMI